MAAQEPPIVLFDGLCGLCDRFVIWLIRRDKGRRLRFAPLQGTTAAERLSGELIQGMDTVVLLDDKGMHTRSDAALRTVWHLGGIWRVAVVLRIIPRALRDSVYDLIARHRHRWFGKRAECRIPEPADRDRFLP